MTWFAETVHLMWPSCKHILNCYPIKKTVTLIVRKIVYCHMCSWTQWLYSLLVQTMTFSLKKKTYLQTDFRCRFLSLMWESKLCALTTHASHLPLTVKEKHALKVNQIFITLWQQCTVKWKWKFSQVSCAVLCETKCTITASIEVKRAIISRVQLIKWLWLTNWSSETIWKRTLKEFADLENSV